MIPAEIDVCIVGLGPAGLGAALQVARADRALSVVCLEAGVSANSKYCTILQGKGCRHAQPCHMVSGVGGSSLLSGGKISAYPAGRALTQILQGEEATIEHLNQALSAFSEYIPLTPPGTSASDAQSEAARYAELGFEFRYYDACLYHQSDLVAGYSRMVSELCSLGVSVLCGTELLDAVPTEAGFSVLVHGPNGDTTFSARSLVVAVGRGGGPLIQRLSERLELSIEPNACDVGIRLELPVALWPNIDRHHKDLKLHFGPARTFCVCKDGMLAPYRVGDLFLIEGQAELGSTTGFTNLAITVRWTESHGLLDDVRARVLAQTGGIPVRQQLSEFLTETRHAGSDRAPASIHFWRWGDVGACFPDGPREAIRSAVHRFAERLLPQSAWDLVSVFAPEMDYYWPRVTVGAGFRSPSRGLYIAGDSVGQFRGILQAFCSGRVAAEALLADTRAH